jgi:hypothetical protein
MLISCGTVCLNVRLAAHHFGFQMYMERALLNEQPEFLVRLRLGPDRQHQKKRSASSRLFLAGSVYEESGVPGDILSRLQYEAGREGTWLHLVEDDQTRRAIAQRIAAGDREQWANEHFRHKLAAWVYLRATEKGDGLPASAQAKGSLRTMSYPFFVRIFDNGQEEATRDQRLSAGASVLAVLGMFADTRADWFAAGQALERMLLEACARGLQTSFVNQPVEVPACSGQVKPPVSGDHVVLCARLNAQWERWRLSGSQRLGSVAPVNVSDHAIDTRMERAVTPLQWLCDQVSARLQERLAPWEDRHLAPWATAVSAADASTCDRLSRFLPWLRTLAQG